jgi:hypothetical protein
VSAETPQAIGRGVAATENRGAGLILQRFAGSIVYRQHRIGLNRLTFEIW